MQLRVKAVEFNLWVGGGREEGKKKRKREGKNQSSSFNTLSALAAHKGTARNSRSVKSLEGNSSALKALLQGETDPKGPSTKSQTGPGSPDCSGAGLRGTQPQRPK